MPSTHVLIIKYYKKIILYKLYQMQLEKHNIQLNIEIHSKHFNIYKLVRRYFLSQYHYFRRQNESCYRTADIYLC